MKKSITLPDFKTATTEQLEANLENMEKELAAYQKHKTHNESLIELHRKRYDLKKQLSAISDVKNRVIEPIQEFQRDPEWIKLHSQWMQLETEQALKNLQDEIDELATRVEKTNDEIARFEEAIPKIKAEIARRGE